VQNLAKRKTLRPILVRINALYTLRTSFFFFFFIVVIVVQKLAKRKTLHPILVRIKKHIGPQIRTDPWE
jgi:hypothetical protein